MKVDILKAYLKYKLGLTVGLPAFVINSVEECDNGEPLIDIKKLDVRLFFGGRLEKENKVFLRKSVADKIVKAIQSLPSGICFIIYDAYRPLSVQQQEWDNKYKYYQSLYPNESEEQITIRTKKGYCRPTAWTWWTSNWWCN